MSSKYAKGQGSADGFVRAVWDAQKDLELAHHGTVHWVVSLNEQQRGVYRIGVAFWQGGGGVAARQVASYTRDYPNGDVGSLEGYLFSCITRLSVLVDVALTGAGKPEK